MPSRLICVCSVLLPSLLACSTNTESTPAVTATGTPSSPTVGDTAVAPANASTFVGHVDSSAAASSGSSVAAASLDSATGSESDVRQTQGDVATSESGPAVEHTDVGSSGGDVSRENSRRDASSSDLVAESSPATGELLPIKVYVAGDSTVSSYRDTQSTTDQAGWGQMLHQYLSDLAVVDNRAVGGTTSRSFIDFGHFDKLAADIAAGDTLLVQFGTNDGNKTATYDLDGQEIPYYLDPATDYKTYLSKYIDFAKGRGANLVLVTPPPRNSAYCTGGNGTGGHAQAMRELAAERGVVLADLNQRSVDYLKAICPAPTPEDFFALRADGSVDGTHFQENGARLLARFVVEGVAGSEAPLARYVIDARE